MRAAPAVQVVVERRGAWRAGIALLGALTVAVLALWLVRKATDAGGFTVAGVAFALAALVLWHRAPIDTGPLAWDGSVWTFAGQAGTVRVVIDLDGWMLLRFDAQQTRSHAWLAVGSAAAGATWHALRAAVYSRRPKQEP